MYKGGRYIKVQYRMQACCTVRVKIFASDNFRRFRECPPFVNNCVANITLDIYMCKNGVHCQFFVMLRHKTKEQ